MCKRMFWGEQMDNYQYNRVEKGSFSAIQGLTNAQKMVELASESNKRCLYRTLLLFKRLGILPDNNGYGRHTL